MPISLIVLGIALFIVSALGFIFAGVESKPALFGYAIVMGIISIAQIATIFFIMEARSVETKLCAYMTSSLGFRWLKYSSLEKL